MSERRQKGLPTVAELHAQLQQLIRLRIAVAEAELAYLSRMAA